MDEEAGLDLLAGDFEAEDEVFVGDGVEGIQGDVGAGARIRTLTPVLSRSTGRGGRDADDVAGAGDLLDGDAGVQIDGQGDVVAGAFGGTEILDLSLLA